MRRVVITGLGPVTSVGVGKRDFWDSLQAGRSGIGPITRFDAGIFNARNASEIRGWAPETYFPPHRLKRLDRYAQFAVTSVALALADAGLQYSPAKPQPRV